MMNSVMACTDKACAKTDRDSNSSLRNLAGSEGDFHGKDFFSFFFFFELRRLENFFFFFFFLKQSFQSSEELGHSRKTASNCLRKEDLLFNML